MSTTARAAGGSESRATEPVRIEPRAAAEPGYELVDLDRYAVLDDGPVGYVEVVPPLFVCYVGHPYPTAEEVAQVHDFHRAVDTVREHAGARRRRRAS